MLIELAANERAVHGDFYNGMSKYIATKIYNYVLYKLSLVNLQTVREFVMRSDWIQKLPTKTFVSLNVIPHKHILIYT